MTEEELAHLTDLQEKHQQACSEDQEGVFDAMERRIFYRNKIVFWVPKLLAEIHRLRNALEVIANESAGNYIGYATYAQQVLKGQE